MITTGKEVTYPIAEEFTSPQGEGVWSGTRMRFIRLAGCNVGKYQKPLGMGNKVEELESLRLLNPEHSICTTSLGQQFLCDTNYKKTKNSTVTELLDDASDVRHICITGGEPFMHDLEPLVTQAVKRRFTVHIETSGTLHIPPYVGTLAWITCSPKIGFMSDNRWAIKEYKFVIGKDIEWQSVLRRISDLVGKQAFETGENLAGNDSPYIYIQPVNGINDLDFDAIETCLQLQKLAPHLAISVQLHKVLKVR